MRIIAVLILVVTVIGWIAVLNERDMVATSSEARWTERLGDAGFELGASVRANGETETLVLDSWRCISFTSKDADPNNVSLVVLYEDGTWQRPPSFFTGGARWSMRLRAKRPTIVGVRQSGRGSANHCARQWAGYQQSRFQKQHIKVSEMPEKREIAVGEAITVRASHGATCYNYETSGVQVDLIKLEPSLDMFRAKSGSGTISFARRRC
jgi:hypothetical protein